MQTQSDGSAKFFEAAFEFEDDRLSLSLVPASEDRASWLQEYWCNPDCRMQSGDALALVIFLKSELQAVGFKLEQAEEGKCYPRYHYNLVRPHDNAATWLAQLAGTRPLAKHAAKAKFADVECSGS